MGKKGGGGGNAASASLDAARIQAGTQEEALDYLREVDEVPRGYRESALGDLADIGQRTPEQIQANLQQAQQYGIGSAQNVLDASGLQRFGDLSRPDAANIQDDALYQAQVRLGQRAGEQSLLRNAAATGGLRSGNAQEALYSQSADRADKALLGTYGIRSNEFLQDLNQNNLYAGQFLGQAGADQNQFLGQQAQDLGVIQGLANLPSNANQIAGLIQGIGTTQAQGLTAAAQARASGQQQGFSNLLGLGSLGLGAYSAFSDPRLKDNVELVGQVNDVNFYTWTWNKKANELGQHGQGFGVMADEHLDCSYEDESGYLKVYYSKVMEKANA